MNNKFPAKSKPYILLCVALFFLAIGILSSCSIFGAGGKARLTFVLSSAIGAKTLQPALDLKVVKYDINGAGPGSETFLAMDIDSSSHFQSDLLAGSWTVRATGKNEAGIVLVRSEPVTVALTPGETTTVALSCLPLPGDGTFTLKLTWPVETVRTATIEATLTPTVGDPVAMTFVIVGTSATYTSLPLARGYYTLKLKLLDASYDKFLVWSWNEAVLIFTDQPTIADWRLIASDMDSHALNVTLTLASDVKAPISIALSGYVDKLPRGSTMTVSATGMPTPDSWAWFLDGDLLAGQTSSNITIGAGLAEGSAHSLVTIGRKGEIAGSAGIRFRILAPIPTTTTTTTIASLPAFVHNPGEGAMLLRHGANLYRLGGQDGIGRSSTSTRMAVLDSGGNVGIWQDTAPLPCGIQHGVALAAGGVVYVLGGRNNGELVSTIRFTSINTDGTLGFGTDKHWESNVRPLPEARANAAWAVHDGWVFLIGGETVSGATDSIIRARIYQDGQIGQWYESAQVLPGACWGTAAAVMGERLYVAGGADLRGVKSDVVSFTMGEYGSLSDRRIETSLPTALQETVLAADREDLIIAGGYGIAAGQDAVYRYHGGMWSAVALEAAAAGPSSGQAGGALFFMPQSNAGGAEAVRLAGLSLAPEIPVVLPGTGMVPTNSPIRVVGGADVTVRYRTDGGTPTSSDPMWPASPIKISLTTLPSMKLSLAAFSSGGTVSPIVRRDYRVRTGSLFVMIENTLQIHESGYSDLEHRILEETTATGMRSSSSLWYRMRIATAGHYRLTWADADENAAFSAKIMLSVYEADLYTEVPDLDDIPARDRRSGMTAPIRMALHPGDYYVYIRDIDSMTGRDFGLALARA